MTIDELNDIGLITERISFSPSLVRHIMFFTVEGNQLESKMPHAHSPTTGFSNCQAPLLTL